MANKRFLNGITILLPIAFLLLSGCGKGKGLKVIQGDPEVLYKQGLALFNKRDYPEALKKFEQLKSNFPDSPPFTVWAELKIGDSHFFNKDYVQAIAAYEEFRKIHPTHEEIPYVQYQIGMAYFNQMLSLDRDQTPTRKALSSFENLVANYPPSIFTQKAQQKIGVCRKRLADHEFYVGNFYYKHGKYQAAVLRFEGLLEKFPAGDDADRTLFLLGKSYMELDQWEKAGGAFAKIVTNYPRSPYFKEAVTLLKGIKEKASLRGAKAKESKSRREREEAEEEAISLVKFEEEGKQSVSLKEERGSMQPVPPKEEIRWAASSLARKPMEEGRVQAISAYRKTDLLKGETLRTVGYRATSAIEGKADEEKRMVALPVTLQAPASREKSKKELLPGQGETESLDRNQPIEITSERVETYSKENLIIFKGDVTARQKDMVIYADSIEAWMDEGSKGIEKVVADGNVKIQQGLRVGTSQKAVFYNREQRVVLTGNPRAWEGDNTVSGDEIVFDMEKNRVEVKGGPAGRGRAKVHPGRESERPK
jgi:outer membrane protein assembly factor BamD